MSNEELVLAIQGGDIDAREQLWEQVKLFVRQQANTTVAAVNNHGGITTDDLIQCGYIAMERAAATYKADSGATFLTWLGYYIRAEFQSAAGLKLRKPLDSATSLDEPLREDSDSTLADVIAGPDPIEPLIDRIHDSELSEAIDQALASLEEGMADIVKARFIGGETRKSYAARTGRTVYEISRDETRAITKLLRDPVLAAATDDTDYYAGMGLHHFVTTGESGVETIAFKHDRAERRRGG